MARKESLMTLARMAYHGKNYTEAMKKKKKKAEPVDYEKESWAKATRDAQAEIDAARSGGSQATKSASGGSSGATRTADVTRQLEHAGLTQEEIDKLKKGKKSR